VRGEVIAELGLRCRADQLLLLAHGRFVVGARRHIISRGVLAGNLGPVWEGWAPAPPKTAPAQATLVERLLRWSWSRFRKRLTKRLHVGFMNIKKR
jgi:hypothetical protein